MQTKYGKALAFGAHNPNTAKVFALDQWNFLYESHGYLTPTSQQVITPLELDVELTAEEDLQIAPLTHNEVAKAPLQELLCMDEFAETLQNKGLLENMSMDDEAAFLSARVRYLVELLSMYDDWQLGGDLGFRKSFSEQFELSAELLNNPQKLAEEALKIYDRLRLAGAFDNTNTRVAASILKAGMTTEKL